MNNYMHITAQAQSPLSIRGTSTKPVMAPSSAGNTASVVVVTEAQPSPSSPVSAQLTSFGNSNSVAELAALALTLTAFVAVVIALTKR